VVGVRVLVSLLALHRERVRVTHGLCRKLLVHSLVLVALTNGLSHQTSCCIVLVLLSHWLLHRVHLRQLSGLVLLRHAHLLLLLLLVRLGVGGHARHDVVKLVNDIVSFLLLGSRLLLHRLGHLGVLRNGLLLRHLLGGAHEIKQVALRRRYSLRNTLSRLAFVIGNGVHVSWVNQRVFCRFAWCEAAGFLSILDSVIALECLLEVVVD
jgi:hypothetical protein